MIDRMIELLFSALGHILEHSGCKAILNPLICIVWHAYQAPTRRFDGNFQLNVPFFTMETHF
jgi:hypothetical protein